MVLKTRKKKIVNGSKDPEEPNSVLEPKYTLEDVSQFAQFCIGLIGIQLYWKGSPVDKWEVFESGYTNPVLILTNTFERITHSVKPKIDEQEKK